jgi:small subunit ribosomal protein S13
MAILSSSVLKTRFIYTTFKNVSPISEKGKPVSTRARASIAEWRIVYREDRIILSTEYRHILRVAGTNLDGSKQIPYGLSTINGVSVNYARAVVKASNMSETLRLGNLSDSELQRLEEILRNPGKYGIPSWLMNRQKDRATGESFHLIDPDLTLKKKEDITFMQNIRSWKGIRHSLGLKVRGQRTKTTGRTGRSVGVKKSQLIKKPVEE